MAPEVIACDENPDSTYDCKVSSYITEYELLKYERMWTCNITFICCLVVFNLR